MAGDFRLALRALRASPIVTIVAVLSLALGIGANTAIFSLVNSLLLRTLPVAEPERLVVASSNNSGDSFTYAIWEEIRRHAGLFDGVLAWSSERFNLGSAGEIRPVDGLYVSGEYFQTLGVTALVGRAFTADDDVKGGGKDGAVAVLSYPFWQQHLGGALDVIGQSITIEAVPFTIVGVTPPEFFGTEVGRRFDIAVPIGDEPLILRKDTRLDRRSTWWLTILLRRKPRQSIDAATAALRGVQPQIRGNAMPRELSARFQQTFLRDPLVCSPAATGTSPLRERYERPLLTILVVVGLVLLIACANIANLSLARATARRHELSVRLALGASGWRLARQMFVENLLLAAAGALAGLAFAVWGSRALVAQLSTQTNRVNLDLPLDWRVLGFTAGVTIATALLFGTAPAIRASGVAPIEALKEHGRGMSSDHRFSVSSGLVVAQVALSLVLIVAAGLFVRTLSRLTRVPLGFDHERAVVVRVDATRAHVAAADRKGLYLRLVEAAAAVPGVAHAGASVITPVSGNSMRLLVRVPGATELPDKYSAAFANYVTPDWFATYGTALIAGRLFDQRDTLASPPVVVVNEKFTRVYFPNTSALGRIVEYPSPMNTPRPSRQVVGIVGDAVYRNLRDPIEPAMYMPLAQYDEVFPLSSINIAVRAATDAPLQLSRGIASALTGVDRDLAFSFRLLSDQVRASLLRERLVALLSGFFGGLALLLAALGLYGVTAYGVSRRRAEIGIRLALGAAPGGVVRLVLSRVALLVGAGVAIGAVICLWAAHFVRTMLFGLEPDDPATFAVSAAMLAAIGGIAGWLPARRASRVDPVEVLRDS